MAKQSPSESPQLPIFDGVPLPRILNRSVRGIPETTLADEMRQLRERAAKKRAKMGGEI